MNENEMNESRTIQDFMTIYMIKYKYTLAQ